LSLLKLLQFVCSYLIKADFQPILFFSKKSGL